MMCHYPPPRWNILLTAILFLASQVHHLAVADVSIQQIFDAVDTNHDHSISQSELEGALSRLMVGTSNIEAVAVGGGGGAPPLGLDSNPFAYKREQQSQNSGSGNNSNNDHSKFDNPKKTKDFLKALVSSFSAIIATEIGDKTFFIAAVLSMRNDRIAVFGGAIMALIIMTILSTMMGLVLPSLMPRKYTHILGGILFLYFGIKLLVDSRSMEDKVSEELEEVEEELAELNKKQSKAKKKKKMVNEASSIDDDLEGQDGEIESADAGGDKNSDGAKQRRGGNKNLKHASSSGLSAAGGYSGTTWEGVFVQSLTLTFLAEWGDRSQIATIALAAAKDPVGVTIGGCVGHSICTGMAVLGGRMLASRISEKSVAFYGGLVFLVFGMHSLFFEE
eukprot:CCRYP_012958-RA/>CCRYP_012958-RA protein AED:0.17 eAED:0.17 QI:171/1/1/1/1/1/2/3013/390